MVTEHAETDVLLIAEVVPAGQLVQDEAPNDEYVPAAQSEQLDTPPAEYVPAAH